MQKKQSEETLQKRLQQLAQVQMDVNKAVGEFNVDRLSRLIKFEKLPEEQDEKQQNQSRGTDMLPQKEKGARSAQSLLGLQRL